MAPPPGDHQRLGHVNDEKDYTPLQPDTEQSWPAPTTRPPFEHQDGLYPVIHHHFRSIYSGKLWCVNRADPALEPHFVQIPEDDRCRLDRREKHNEWLIRKDQECRARMKGRGGMDPGYQELPPTDVDGRPNPGYQQVGDDCHTNTITGEAFRMGWKNNEPRFYKIPNNDPTPQKANERKDDTQNGTRAHTQDAAPSCGTSTATPITATPPTLLPKGRAGRRRSARRARTARGP